MWAEFKFQALEIGGCDLKGVKDESGYLRFEFAAKEEFGDLAESELDGLRILKGGETNFAGGIIAAVGVIGESNVGAMLVVETKLIVFDGGRSALSSAGFDVLTFWRVVGHRLSSVASSGDWVWGPGWDATAAPPPPPPGLLKPWT